jgi:hypothetical protein
MASGQRSLPDDLTFWALLCQDKSAWPRPAKRATALVNSAILVLNLRVSVNSMWLSLFMLFSGLWFNTTNIGRSFAAEAVPFVLTQKEPKSQDRKKLPPAGHTPWPAFLSAPRALSDIQNMIIITLSMYYYFNKTQYLIYISFNPLNFSLKKPIKN